VTDPDPSLLPFGSPEAWARAFATARAALARRYLSVLGITLVFLAAGVLAAVVTPRTFSTDARLLVRKVDIMPALAHPRRAVPMGGESLTQSAAALVRDRRALRTIVEDHGLADRWRRDRPLVLRIKDEAVARVRGPVPDDELVETLIDLLARRVTVTVDGEVVRVWAQWTDAQTAVDIVAGATEAYLQARRRADIDAIAETHKLLEQTADSVRTDVERQVAASSLTQHLRPRPRLREAEAVPAPVALSDPLARLRSQTVEAREASEAAVAAHRQIVRALEGELAGHLAVATDRHPDVVAVRRRLDQAGILPDPVLQAQAAAMQLSAAYVAAGGRLDDLEAGAASRQAPSAATQSALVTVTQAPDDDDATVYARSLLERSISTYQDLLERLSNARIELETARAAFGYRYTVIAAARHPRRPDAPNVWLIVLGAACAGLAAGSLRALWLERGR